MVIKFPVCFALFCNSDILISTLIKDLSGINLSNGWWGYFFKKLENLTSGFKPFDLIVLTFIKFLFF